MSDASGDVGRYQANLQDEIDGEALYIALAGIEDDPNLAEVYRRLAESERRHADVWREKLRELSVDAPDPSPGWRTRTLILLAGRFGPGLILPTVVGREQADRAKYDDQPDTEAGGMAADERSHARMFEMIGSQTPSGLGGPSIARIEGRHRAGGGNALRAAVLGANDGLVSNISLVMGVAGADLAARNILVTGLAGLLAGSLSMALGEWLSVQSARELYENQIRTEREELLAFPAEEVEELTLIYRSRGIVEGEARRLAEQIVSDPANALETLACEELSIDPQELGGSAWVAAITSFVLFSIGAIIPVLPYFFSGGLAAVVVSVGLSAVALFVIGAAITIITGRSALASGLRQVVFGIAAAAITYGLGWLVGGQIG